MKHSLITVLLLLGGFACEKRTEKTAAPAALPQPSATVTANIPKNGNYTSKGRVTKVDLTVGSVELDHEDIPGVMPAMRMEFYVTDKTQLDPIKVGDDVEFVLRYKDHTETIVGITKIKK